MKKELVGIFHTVNTILKYCLMFCCVYMGYSHIKTTFCYVDRQINTREASDLKKKVKIIKQTDLRHVPKKSTISKSVSSFVGST